MSANNSRTAELRSASVVPTPASPTISQRTAAPITDVQQQAVTTVAALPPAAAQTSPVTTLQVAPTALAAPARVAAPAAVTAPVTVPRIVSGLLASFGLSPLAANTPLAPAEPPMVWGLLAWARREFENAVSNSGRSVGIPSAPVAAAVNPTAMAVAPTAAAVTTPTTVPVGWVTGPGLTDSRFGIYGTDLGIMWDNGIPDNPATPVNEHQVLMAFGDTFSGANMSGTWRSNVLLRSADPTTLSVANGSATDIFAGSPLDSGGISKQIIYSSPSYLGPQGSEVTIIPTASISVP